MNGIIATHKNDEGGGSTRRGSIANKQASGQWLVLVLVLGHQGSGVGIIAREKEKERERERERRLKPRMQG